METRIPGEVSFEDHFFDDSVLDRSYSFFYIPISWSAIFAGLVTTLSSFICLSFLVSALGLDFANLSSSSPLESSFLSVGIGSLLIMVISLSFGSFVAGRFAEVSGAIHGFLTWGLLTLFTALQTILFVSSSAHLGTQIVSSAFSGKDFSPKDVVSFLSGLNDEHLKGILQPNTAEEIDFDRVRSDLHDVLDSNKISSLNPERLKNIYQSSLKEIDMTLTALKKDPSHYDLYLTDLSDRLSDQARTITTKIDQDDIIDNLIDHGIDKATAQAMTTDAVNIYRTAEDKTKRAIKSFEEQASRLSKAPDMLAKDSHQIANKALNTASNVGWWGFFGGLIGAIISSIFGYYGYRSRKNSFML